MPMALHAVDPEFWGKCLEQQLLSDVVNSCCCKWHFDLHILTLNRAWAGKVGCA